MKVVIYTRKSTEQDERQALSLEAQLRELQQYVAEQQLQIVASFQEAKTAKEPESNRSGRTSSHRKIFREPLKNAPNFHSEPVELRQFGACHGSTGSP